LFLRLEWLARRCKPQDTAWPGTIWPDRGFLRDLENDVMFLIATKRKKQPSPAWKAFQLLNRLLRSLRLVLRVNNLVKRARERLKEAGESPMSKLERQAEQGDEDARKLLRDIAAIRDGQAAAKKIDWTQHERALAQFSRTRSVEPSYGRSAPLESRCYARALELVVEDYRRKPLRDKSWPLVEWLARIGHPEAKSLAAFDDVWAWIVEQEEEAWRGKSGLRRREKGRDRIRRYREWHRGRWLYPGDWIRFRDAADFRAFYGRKQPLPETCVGLYDSDSRSRLEAVLDTLSCASTLPGSKRPRRVTDEPDGFYYHRTRRVARCRDCQNAEWEAQGFEVWNGFPYGDWSLTTAERIAENDKYAAEKLAQWKKRQQDRLKAMEAQNTPRN